MNKAIRVVIGVAIVVAGAYVGFRYYAARRARKAGIIAEKIEHHGDQLRADFTARLPAPPAEVFNAIEHVENSHSDNVKQVRIVSQEGNKKTVDLQMEGPGGQPFNMRLAFEYFPAQGRITYQTVGNSLLETKAEYNLTDDRGGTLIHFRQTTRTSQQWGAPDAIVDQIVRSIFVAQLEGLEHALNITTAEEEEDHEQEP